jgi:transposase
MKGYSLDLRERIVKFIQEGGSKAETARRFGLARSSVYRYLDAVMQGTLAPKKSWGHWRKLDPQQLHAHVQKHPDATLKELQRVFGVRHHALWVRLRQLDFTLKKLIKYRERNEVQRWIFWRELENLGNVPAFYLEECGVDHRLYREYGRARRGERSDQEIPGKRRERTSIISASQNGKLVAPLWCFKAVAIPKWWMPICPSALASTAAGQCHRAEQCPVSSIPDDGQAGGASRLPAVVPTSLLAGPQSHRTPVAAFKTRLRQHLSTATNPFLFIANMFRCCC